MESVPSSTRPSISEAGPTYGPIPTFDVHLRYLSDSYITFFQDRKKIEESYIDALLKLHRKVKVIDAALEERGEPTTVRIAWNEVREHCEREAQTRQAFLGSLVTDVLQPLVAFREVQDRTRKRIKEDIKQSTAAYDEYADEVLTKLKRNYIRKCQDADEHRMVNTQTVTSPTQPQAPLPQPSSPPSGPPVVTGPQPLRPLTRRASGGHTSRNRSPSSGTALSDLAHQGKRQLNQLMTFLDKSNTMKDGLGGRSDAALRSVRTKREADEADKEYRKGVHHLETLRIRRKKILQGGFMSLQLFVSESAEMLKKVLIKYTDNLTATTTTQTHLSEHVREYIERISPAVDVGAVTQRISRAIASAIPAPVLYHNYVVGECNDLIFGVSLGDYAHARNLPDGEIPKIVRLCIAEVDARGLECEGIYRVSGRHAIVHELQRKVELSERSFSFNPATDDIYVVSSLLKLYLRELPEPVFRFPLQDRIQHSEDFDDHKTNNFSLLRAKMRRLPAIHLATLKALIEHLARVTQYQSKNKMDVKNLAIVFNSVIFGEDELPKASADLLNMQAYQDTLFEDLIENAHVLFDDHPEPPLPPAPVGETPEKVVLGTTHTKVAHMPPLPPRVESLSAPSTPLEERAPTTLRPEAPSTPTPSPRHERPQIFPTNPPPADFTPELPSYPINSIHPSARANPMPSPTRATAPLPGPPPPAPVPVPEPVSTLLPFPPPTVVQSLLPIQAPSPPRQAPESQIRAVAPLPPGAQPPRVPLLPPRPGNMSPPLPPRPDSSPLPPLPIGKGRPVGPPIMRRTSSNHSSSSQSQSSGGEEPRGRTLGPAAATRPQQPVIERQSTAESFVTAFPGPDDGDEQTHVGHTPRLGTPSLLRTMVEAARNPPAEPTKEPR